jgi:hypothetical protein
MIRFDKYERVALVKPPTPGVTPGTPRYGEYEGPGLDINDIHVYFYDTGVVESVPRALIKRRGPDTSYEHYGITTRDKAALTQMQYHGSGGY